MKRLVQFVTRLYPAAWRSRYEAEFHVFLEDLDADWRTLLDVARGAVAMQLRAISLRKMVALGGLVGLLLGFGVWVVIPKQYDSVAFIKVQGSQGAVHPLSNQLISDRISGLLVPLLSDKSLARIIRNYKLYPDKQAKLPLEEIAAEMRRSIQIQPTGQDALFFRFRYNDPAVAQRVTRELVSHFVVLGIESGAKGKPLNLALHILDWASLPTNPTAPNLLGLAVIGLFAGILAGLAAAVVRRISGAKIIP